MRKILVIDDEIEMCEMIRNIFEKKNFEVIYSIDGKNGLDLFYHEKPGTVILDLYLGDTSGLDILKRIKTYDPSCCVVMITGSQIKDNKRHALELGADSYIHKPFNIEDLKNCVFFTQNQKIPLYIQ